MLLRCSARYNGLHHFLYNASGVQYDMVFTSVLGHLMELEFEARYKKWRGCSPAELYQAAVAKHVPQVP